MSSKSFISAAELAKVCGISERKMRQALARAHNEGKPWRGHHLIVRTVAGRGGAAGLQYEVRIDSLPPEFQERGEAAHAEGNGAALVNAKTDLTRSEWSWRLQIIRPALAHKADSAARSAAIRAIVEAEHVDSDGCLRRFCENTIRDWIKRYEARGVDGLNRKGRTDRGQFRAILSRDWDRATAAAGLTQEQQTEIAATIRRYVRSLWAGPATFAGWRRIAKLASDKLADLTAAALGPDRPAIDAALCKIKRKFVERERAYRVVGIHDRDRAEFDNHQRGRIGRAIEHMLPMEVVKGDAHPNDVYYTRDDSSIATAKLVGWLDTATRRMWVLVALLEKGEGIRQEHAIRAFIGMALDPRWGLPSTLYLDNGREYDWTGFVDDAMRLKDIRIEFDGQVVAKGKSSTIRAQPYNAPAKGDLEGGWGNLERHFVSFLPGWIGGDRMRKKTEHVGKPPAPFPGNHQALVEAIQNAVAIYNATPQQGQLKGLSPDQAFAAHVEAGWRRTDISEADLLAAFCKKEVRAVDQGVIKVGNDRLRDDALARLPAKSRVTIGLPKWGEAGKVAVWDEHGAFLCIAVADKRYGHSDRAGAIEAGRRRKLTNAYVADLRRDVDKLDGTALLREEAARIPPTPVPERGAVVRLGRDQAKAGKALMETPAARRSREIEAEAARLAHFDDVIDRLEASGGRR